MGSGLGIGLLGLGTVGGGVASILQNPNERHPLVADLRLIRVAVQDLKRPRSVELPIELFTTDPFKVVNDPTVDVVVELIGGIEPARSLILQAIAKGKSIVTANKAVIARHGQEIADAAAKAGVYVLIEAAVGGGIPIIEPLKQSLGGNRINRVSGIINGTTSYILTRMVNEGAAYESALEDAQNLGYAEANPAADVDGIDAADKIAILAALAFGGSVDRSNIPTTGISHLKGRDMDCASQLGYSVKLLAVAERMKESAEPLPLSLRVQPTLIPNDHPLAGVNGVNNAILVEGDPIGQVMFYGPGAGAGPTASAVVADILNIAGIRQAGKMENRVDPLLAASSWRNCVLVDQSKIRQCHYLRFCTQDTPGVIGRIGGCFGEQGVSIQSIIQLNANKANAEIVVITHEVSQSKMEAATKAIEALPEVINLAAHLGCL
ncbi:homoserine dehydrogenase [Synechococcus sp. M16CYN]|uniref:homoserine dehydrogenase n=1 Tax=Synechococcus sp. M16CYN TaxID=3103139 RepID=UPI003253092F